LGNKKLRENQIIPDESMSDNSRVSFSIFGVKYTYRLTETGKVQNIKIFVPPDAYEPSKWILDGAQEYADKYFSKT
jgi:hypothetical protein